MLSLRTLPAVLALGLALAACQPAEKKAVKEEAKVISDSGLVCNAAAEVEKALEKVDDLTPASTVADAEAAGASLKKALATFDKAEKELQSSKLKEYRDQVEIYEKFVGEIRKNKSMTLEEAAQQLKAKAAPVIAAHDQFEETMACLEVDESTNADAETTRETSKEDGSDKADS